MLCTLYIYCDAIYKIENDNFLFVFLLGWRRCQGHCSIICWHGWFICWAYCNWCIFFTIYWYPLFRAPALFDPSYVPLNWFSSSHDNPNFLLWFASLLSNIVIFFLLPGSDESMVIVNALLEVASHPEYDIASMTFNFWHSLQVILTRRWIHMELC